MMVSGEKNHLVTYTELVPCWRLVGSASRELGEVSKTKRVEEKVNSFPPSIPNS